MSTRSVLFDWRMYVAIAVLAIIGSVLARLDWPSGVAIGLAFATGHYMGERG